MLPTILARTFISLYLKSPWGSLRGPHIRMGVTGLWMTILCPTEQQGQKIHLNFWLTEFWRSLLNIMPGFSFKEWMWGVGVLCSVPGGRTTEVKRAWCFLPRLGIFFLVYEGSTNFFQGSVVWWKSCIGQSCLAFQTLEKSYQSCYFLLSDKRKYTQYLYSCVNRIIKSNTWLI